MPEKNGTYLITQQRIALIATVKATPLFFSDGGIIIAVNMAYKAIPSEQVTIAGRILPHSAPASVPVVQPMYGKKDSPKKYLNPMGLGLETATAKISSVINVALKSLMGRVKLSSNFCDSEKLIKK